MIRYNVIQMNEEEKKVAPSEQNAARNGGAWIGDKKISGFLKIFKKPGQQTSLDRLSSDIGAASVKPAFENGPGVAAPKDIFEKAEQAASKETADKSAVPTNVLRENKTLETETPKNNDAIKLSETTPVAPELRQAGRDKPEMEIISAKEEALGMGYKSDDDTEIKRLRTYKEDVAEALKREKTTVVKMVLDEQRRKEGLAEMPAESPKKNALLTWLSIILLVLGGGTIGAIYVFKKTDEATINKSGGKIASLIFAENEQKISVTDAGSGRLGKLIKTEVVGADIRLDTIENLYFTEIGNIVSSKGELLETGINSARLWSALGINLPPVLLRSLSDEFMFGIHAWNGNQSFIILKNDFYENAFAGMLKWEESMAKDLLPIMTSKPADSFFGELFRDLVIKNRDIRGIVDENGEPVLMYTFVNRETVVIATHKDTLNEVISRLVKTNININ